MASSSAVIDAKRSCGFHMASDWKASGIRIIGFAEAVGSMVEKPGTQVGRLTSTPQLSVPDPSYIARSKNCSVSTPMPASATRLCRDRGVASARKAKPFKVP